MKKLFTFLIMFLLATSVGWAEEVTSSLIFTAKCNGSGTSDDGFVWTITSDGAESNFDNTSGIHYGTNNASVTYVNLSTSGITKTIKKIVVNARDAQSNAKIHVTVGNTVFPCGANNYQQINNTSQDYTFTGSASGTILVNVERNTKMTKAIYVKSIIVTYEDEGGTTTETVATPTFSPAEGTYTSAQNVTISCATSGAAIHYTTDGTTPTTSSPTYSSAIPVSSTTTIKALAVKSGMNNSAVASATYTIETPQPSGSKIFERINSASQLEAGKRYILVYEGTPAAMGAITSSGTKYGISVTGSGNFTISNGIATLTENSSVKPLTLGGSSGAWTFNLDGALLNHTSGNSLSTGTSNTTWTISFSGNNVTITNATNDTRVIKYNSSSPRFACYESGQQAIQLYKEVESSTSDNLYLIGKDMNSQSGWNISTGPQFTYNNSTGTYAVDAYFDMADRGYFQFVEGLSSSNSNWGGLTGRYYASSYDSDVAVDTYDMDGTVPLYFTNSTQYSPGEYAFTVPAGLYTIVVDKTNWQIYVTQHPVTMTISPNSATFGATKDVTLSSNLTDHGGTIYYTTDGSTPSASNGTPYTGTITLDATTTIKAIAILNHIQSEVVEKTYIKIPAAPEITPASCTFNEPLTVTITAESGATIYYTTDGNDPTSTNGTQYTGPFTVSTTTTVKARAYVGEVYSSIAEATYTYSNVQPSTGDFELVTSSDQLVAGNEYIIVTTYGGTDYAMGALTTSNNPKGSRTTDFTITGNIGTSGSRIAAGSAVNVLKLGGTEDAWTLQQSDESYITLGTNTNISSSSSTCALTIGISNNVATIQGPDSGPTASTPRQIMHQAGSSNCFGNYASSNVGGSNYSGIYLYTRATNAVQAPVFSPVPGIYNVDIDVTITCPTDGATIYYTTDGSEPSATNGTEYTGEIIVSESTTFKAIAIKGENSSNVVTAEYTIQKSTDIETVTLTYREPFTEGIGKFTIQNVSGFSPVWSLDGNYGVKGTSFSGGVNYAATSRLVSPIIDMTDAAQPELTFSHQINSYFNDVTTQATLWIRETSNGTNGTWVQLPISFSDPVAAGGWTNDLVDIDLSDYAGKKVQISFLYTNPTEGSGAGTWEIQNFVVADNSEYKLVDNIAEFLALENGTKAKFRNSVTVLYDYAQRGDQEYIWVKDNSGYMQFFLQPTLNSSETSTLDAKAAYYENGDIIPAGFVVVKNYFENGKYVQAFSTEALAAGFEAATQKGLADPEHMDFSVLNGLDATDVDDVTTWCNRYITLEKIKITSKSGRSFNFANESGTVNACVGYNKYSGDGSLLKDGTTSADVTVPAAGNTYYNVTGIIQLWQGGWEFMPIEFTEWKIDEVTLRKLCADGIVGNDYTISNNVMGVYVQGKTLWVKDDTGQSIWKTAPANNEKNYFVNAEGNTREVQANYDQSNWLEVDLSNVHVENMESFKDAIIKGGSITGKFVNKENPKLEVSEDMALIIDDDATVEEYKPNYYCAANFLDYTGDYLTQEDAVGAYGDAGIYFFMTPKPQEYAIITWATWDGEKMVVPAQNESGSVNGHNFSGAFAVEWDLNGGEPNPALIVNDVYQFKAIIRKFSTGGSSAPRRAETATAKGGQTASTQFVVYPLDLQQDETHVITGVNDVNASAEVQSVTYYDVAGRMSKQAHEGVNIVVTRYTNGTVRTTKVIR